MLWCCRCQSCLRSWPLFWQLSNFQLEMEGLVAERSKSSSLPSQYSWDSSRKGRHCWKLVHLYTLKCTKWLIVRALKSFSCDVNCTDDVVRKRFRLDVSKFSVSNRVVANWNCLSILCSEKKHPLTFSFISLTIISGFKQKLQRIYLRNGRFWQCRN